MPSWGECGGGLQVRHRRPHQAFDTPSSVHESGPRRPPPPPTIEAVRWKRIFASVTTTDTTTVSRDPLRQTCKLLRVELLQAFSVPFSVPGSGPRWLSPAPTFETVCEKINFHPGGPTTPAPQHLPSRETHLGEAGAGRRHALRSGLEKFLNLFNFFTGR
jgi:hypothetical protein